MITPVPYVGTGANAQVTLGHYGVCQNSGLIGATPSALDVHASIRWAPSLSSYYLVLMRHKLGYALAATIAVAVRVAYQSSVVRGFSSDFATAATAISMAAGSGRMRASMAPSQMGANGPRICTTAPQTTFTYTLDTAPFALQVFKAITSTNSAGTVTIMQVGDGAPMQTMYEWTGLGQHPLVLSNNEGVVDQLVHAGWATSSAFTLYTQWEWGEALAF